MSLWIRLCIQDVVIHAYTRADTAPCCCAAETGGRLRYFTRTARSPVELRSAPLLASLDSSSAIVHPVMSLRSSHLVGDHLPYLGGAVVASACSLCQDGAGPPCPDSGYAPGARATR